VGTESVRAGVFDASGTLLGTSAASPHETTYPQPGWAEQSADAWWTGMGAAVRGAIADARCDPASIRCLCLATTSCTVLALDSAGRPLRPALLWMDARSAPEAAEILALGAGDPALSVGGTGPDDQGLWGVIGLWQQFLEQVRPARASGQFCCIHGAGLGCSLCARRPQGVPRQPLLCT